MATDMINFIWLAAFSASVAVGALAYVLVRILQTSYATPTADFGLRGGVKYYSPRSPPQRRR
jgi:hypothetical protein